MGIESGIPNKPTAEPSSVRLQKKLNLLKMGAAGAVLALGVGAATTPDFANAQLPPSSQGVEQINQRDVVNRLINDESRLSFIYQLLTGQSGLALKDRDFTISDLSQYAVGSTGFNENYNNVKNAFDASVPEGGAKVKLFKLQDSTGKFYIDGFYGINPTNGPVMRTNLSELSPGYFPFY